MSKTVIVILLITAVTWLSAISAPAQSAEEQFLALEQSWMDALFKKESAKLEAILAPEFAIVGAGSTASDMLGDRAGWLKFSATRPWPRHEVKIIKVTKVDRFAVVHCILKAEYPPQSITAKGGMITFLVTDVWAGRGGRWQVVSRHSSFPGEK